MGISTAGKVASSIDSLVVVSPDFGSACLILELKATSNPPDSVKSLSDVTCRAVSLKELKFSRSDLAANIYVSLTVSCGILLRFFEKKLKRGIQPPFRDSSIRCFRKSSH